MRNLLIVEPGFQVYKEPIVKAIFDSGLAHLHFATGLHANIPFDWVKPYAKGCFEFSYVENDLTTVAREYEARAGIKFDGVMTYIDMSVHFVNRLQHDLGLPTVSSFTGKEVRSKAEMRRRFEAAGVSQPKFKVIQTIDDLHDFKASSIRYPVIVKPAEMMSSLAVRKIEGENDLDHAVSAARTADFPGEDLRVLYGDISEDVLIEECIIGQEYSVETAVVGGVPHIIGVTRKQTTTDGFFDELGHTFPSVEVGGELYDKVRLMVEKTHGALKIQNSITHLEFKVRDGTPFVIELNNRMGGDLISELVRETRVPFLGRLLAEVSTGRYSATPLRTVTEPFAIRFLSTAKTGRVVKLPTVDVGDSAMTVRFFVREGDMVSPGENNRICRLGYVMGPLEKAERVFRDLDKRIYVEEGFSFLKSAGREIAVVRATLDDWTDLVEVEKSAWGPEHAASESTIRKRLASVNGVTLLAKDVFSGYLFGFFTFVLSKPASGLMNPWTQYASELLSEQPSLSEMNAKNCLHGVSASVRPDAPAGVGASLVRASFELGCELGISSVSYGARITCMREVVQNGGSPEILFHHILSGRSKEPSIQMGVTAGFRPIALVPEYFSDPESMNYGVLMVKEVNHEGLRPSEITFTPEVNDRVSV